MGVTPGDGQGPHREGGGQLEANVLHQDRSIVIRPVHVLLCLGGLHLTLAVSLSLHITPNKRHPSQKAIKLGKPF